MIATLYIIVSVWIFLVQIQNGFFAAIVLALYWPIALIKGVFVSLIVIFNAISVMGKDNSLSFGKFIVQDGIATDTETGLTWLRFEHGQTWQNNTVVGETKFVAWESAFEVAKQFNQCGGYAGFTDWRLPTIDELKTLLEKHKNEKGCYIDADVFPHCEWFVWSSSPYAGSGYSGCALVVNFYDANYGNGGSDGNYVRLVRGG